MDYVTAYIEQDIESGMYIGVIPTIAGAHTCAETIDELQTKLKEVVSLCLEDARQPSRSIPEKICPDHF